MLLTLNKDNLAETLYSNDIVLVEFYADWCSPCNHVQSVLQELNLEYTEDVKMTRINVELGSDITFLYDVCKTPRK